MRFRRIGVVLGAAALALGLTASPASAELSYVPSETDFADCPPKPAGAAKWTCYVSTALEGGFTIKGYFDPPQKQKASISLFDYISGRWLKKPITLPSGTPIELHLDVPLGWDGDLFGLKPAADAAK